MAETRLGDLGLLRIVRDLRQRVVPATPEALTLHQALVLNGVTGAAQGLAVLLPLVVATLQDAAVSELDADNPAVAALATLLGHPAAEVSTLDRLPPAHRRAVDSALAALPRQWDPDRLEWQLVQYLEARAGDVELDPRLNFLQQELPERHQRFAWDALLDLTVLRGRGVL